jgi:hypothetical protein
VSLTIKCWIFKITHQLHYSPQTCHSGSFYDSDLTKAKYASPEEVQAAVKALRKAFPKPHSVELDPECLKMYGSSANSYHATTPHSVIVRPETTEDVVQIVDLSRKYKVPIIPYSGATSLEGHFFGVRCSDFIIHHRRQLYLSLNLHSMPQVAFAWTCLAWIKFLRLMVRGCTASPLWLSPFLINCRGGR